LIYAGALPQTPLGNATLGPIAGFKGPTSKVREERKGEKRGEVRLPHSIFLDPPMLLLY